MKSSSDIPIYKIVVPITGTELVLSSSGDYHLGVRNVSAKEIEFELLEENKKFRGNLFRIFTGDLIENALKTSVGHNYDIEIPDPQIQKDMMSKLLIKVNKDLHGTSFNRLNFDSRTPTTRSIGVIGNHEFRTRKLTGQWIDRDLYCPAKITPIGIEGIIELVVVNKKLKMQKTYKVYVSHRPGKTNATSPESIVRACKKKKASLPGIDIFVFGHFHRGIIHADGYFDSTIGEYKKILYIVNPSPMRNVEYASEAGYPAMDIGYSIKAFLPIENDKQPYGII